MVLPPSRKIDDKAATLEDKLEEKDAEFNKERFVYIFIITALVDVIVGYSAPPFAFSVFVLLSLVLLISMARWLQFPWAVEHLGRLFSLIEKRLGGGNDADTDTEPPMDQS